MTGQLKEYCFNAYNLARLRIMAEDEKRFNSLERMLLR